MNAKHITAIFQIKHLKPPGLFSLSMPSMQKPQCRKVIFADRSAPIASQLLRYPERSSIIQNLRILVFTLWLDHSF